MDPLTNGENGLAVVEVLDAAQISMREGRAVKISEVREQPAASPTEITQAASALDIPRQAAPVRRAM
jgi:hypothetical protein